MKVYTGNFANAKKYKDKGYFCISIALFWRSNNVPSRTELAPAQEYLYAPRAEYVARYKNGLAYLSAIEIMQKIRMLSGNRDAVLLCYEKEGEFCHRQLAAEWLKRELNEEVKELGDMNHKSNQIKMF